MMTLKSILVATDFAGAESRDPFRHVHGDFVNKLGRAS